MELLTSYMKVLGYVARKKEIRTASGIKILTHTWDACQLIIHMIMYTGMRGHNGPERISSIVWLMMSKESGLQSLSLV